MFKKSLEKLILSQDLSEEEMTEAMNTIMEGRATSAQIGSFLTALRLKGETVQEITGAAKVMRRKALKIKFTAPVVIDTCGTGGDGASTFNISTTAAFIVAAAGIPVAKHGNRSVSSRCGSADLLEALGIKCDLPPERIDYSLNKTGLGFLFAPVFHKSVKHVMAQRKELGFRTIFNILGPLTNPGKANCQLIGVYSPELTEHVAKVMKRLNILRAMVVHGHGGLDELSLQGENKVSFLNNDVIKTFSFHPEEFGLRSASNEYLKGGSPEENALITEAILKGNENGPRRDVVLLNAGAALMTSGLVYGFREGMELAERIISSGMAFNKLNEVRNITA